MSMADYFRDSEGFDGRYENFYYPRRKKRSYSRRRRRSYD